MLSPVKQCVRELSALAGLLPLSCGRELQVEMTGAALCLVRSIIGLLALVEQQDTGQLWVVVARFVNGTQSFMR